jgi:hypothetical protein
MHRIATLASYAQITTAALASFSGTEQAAGLLSGAAAVMDLAVAQQQAFQSGRPPQSSSKITRDLLTIGEY